MKKINTSLISDTSRMPLKRGTLAFIQDSHKEALASVLAGLIPSFNGFNVYILWGCRNTGSGSNYIIDSGAAFFLGEVFEVESSAFTAPGGQTAVANIVTTQYGTDADPVTFTDATIKNVHDIRKIQFASGASGSGIKDYANVIFLDLTKSALEALVNGILSSWTLRQNVADVIVSGGTGIVVTSSNIKYKIVGKTMHILYTATISNVTAPTSITILIPDGRTANVGFNCQFAANCYDGAQQKLGRAVLTTGNPDRFQVSLALGQSFSNTEITTVGGQITVEIA